MKGEVVEVREGLVKLEVPAGKVSKSDEVFYNPRMLVCRDLSVLSALSFFERHNMKNAVVLDAFAASGIRGIRYLLECEDHVSKVVFNDLNPKALEWIKHNLKLNGIDKSKVELMREDARVAMIKLRNACALVDIDPFGSPSKYIDCSAESLTKISMLGVTATDTAPLCGTYPIACYRKYLAKSYRYDGMYEAGLRILSGFIIRSFAKHEKAFKPVLCFGMEHFFRVQGEVERKLKIVDDLLLNHIGYIAYCEKCGHREIVDEKHDICEVCKNEKIKTLGPLWTGELIDDKLCNDMLKIAEKEEDWINEKSIKLLSVMAEESKVRGGLVYDTHFICKKWKIKHVPPLERVIEELKAHGYRASRTHLNATAIKTDARIDEIAELMRNIEVL